MPQMYRVYVKHANAKGTKGFDVRTIDPLPDAGTGDGEGVKALALELVADGWFPSMESLVQAIKLQTYNRARVKAAPDQVAALTGENQALAGENERLLAKLAALEAEQGDE